MEVDKERERKKEQLFTFNTSNLVKGVISFAFEILNDNLICFPMRLTYPFRLFPSQYFRMRLAFNCLSIYIYVINQFAIIRKPLGFVLLCSSLANRTLIQKGFLSPPFSFFLFQCHIISMAFDCKRIKKRLPKLRIEKSV